MSEFALAWRSDLRVLIGHDFPADPNLPHAVAPEFLYDIAIKGVQEIDRLLKDSVNVCPRVKHEAEARIHDCLRFTKSVDIFMNPEHIRVFVESSFTSFPLLPTSIGGSYEMSDNGTFGSDVTAMQCIIFYASLFVAREYLDLDTLTRIFNEKMRKVIYPISSSFISSSEDEFATDIIETFPATQEISPKELKKLIISRAFVRNPPAEEIARGKSLLQRIPKLKPEHISDETLTDFMCSYLSHGASFSGDSAPNRMYLLLNLFSSLNAPMPGRLAKPLAWTDKLADRLHTVYLVRRLVSRCVSIDNPTTPRNIFSSQLEEFSKQVDSPPRAAYVVPQLRAPLFHPQRSPDSPDSFRLSPKPSPPKLSVALANFMDNNNQQKSQRDIIVEALQHSGMSPRRAAKSADQFLAGGSSNVDALRATIEESSVHPIAQPSHEERTKFNEIQSMFADIRSLTASRSVNSSRRL